MLAWRDLQHLNLTEAQAKKVTARIASIFESWKDTPYIKNQQCKGVAVDCVRFLAGVADEAYGYERCPTKRLPHDVALHDPERARAAMRSIIRLYSPVVAVEHEVEVLDVIVAGPINGGPGHAMLVSDVPGQVWHATNPRVLRMPINQIERFGYYIVRIYRPTDKDRWLR